MGYLLNLFHIVFVASLLTILAMRLKDGNEALKYTTFAIVSVMVAYHMTRLYQKLSRPVSDCN